MERGHGGYSRGVNWGLSRASKRKAIQVPPPVADAAYKAAWEAWLLYLDEHGWVYVDENEKVYDLSHLRHFLEK